MSILILCILNAAAIAMISWCVLEFSKKHLQQVLKNKRTEYQTDLDSVEMNDFDVNILIALLLFASCGFGILVYVFSGSIFVSLLFSGLILLAPNYCFEHQRYVRRQMIEEQLPDFIDRLVSSSRAGLALQPSLERTCQNLPSPLKREISLILNYMELGDDFSTAIARVKKDLNSKLFNLLASGLQAGHDAGGDLPTMLEDMAKSFREVWRLEKKIYTASAEARKSTKYFVSIPVVLIALMLLFMPEFSGQFSESGAQQLVLWFAIAVFIGGFAWMKKIMRVSV